MNTTIEHEITLPKVSVQVAYGRWEKRHNFETSGYYLCQRLSNDHPALKIGNTTTKAFPRLGSVGFLPADYKVQLYPMRAPFRALSCVFDRHFFENMTEIDMGQWNEYAHKLFSVNNRRIEYMMHEIYSELMRPGFAHEFVVESACGLIMVEMGRYGRRIENTTARKRADPGLPSWQLRKVYERVEASPQLGCYPSLSELARLCGISEGYLMRRFKAATDWPLHRYIAEERLKAAKLLLDDDKLTTKEISTRLGFSSPAYFATAFRRMTGMSPSEFRRSVRQSH